MSYTAYLLLENLVEKTVTYDLGPVRVDHDESRDWYRDSGFQPSPIDGGGEPSEVQVGDGVDGATGNVGTFAKWSTVTSPVDIAVSDEMSHTAPRTLSHTTTWLTFYGNTTTSAVFTTNYAGDANQLSFSAAHGLSNGDLVSVSSSTTLPAGLQASTRYYVVNAASTTLELALTAGGTPITLTSDGTGTHTLTKLQVVSETPVDRILSWSNGESTFVG